jgi:hypothetical protein
MTNQEHATGVKSLYQRFWYVGDLIIMGFLFAYVTYLHSFPLIAYLGGLHNSGVWLFGAAMRWARLLSLAGILLLILIFRLAVSWPKHMRDRKRLWRLQWLTVGSLALYAGVFFVPTWRSYDTFALGLRKYAQTNVDVTAIRAWLSTVDPKDCPGDEVWWPFAGLPEAEKARWPEAILSLKPNLMRLYLDANHRPVVRLEWVGLSEIWGVVVGSVEMEIPKPKPARTEVVGGRTFRECYERPLVIAPGAYVWHEFH